VLYHFGHACQYILSLDQMRHKPAQIIRHQPIRLTNTNTSRLLTKNINETIGFVYQQKPEGSPEVAS